MYALAQVMGIFAIILWILSIMQKSNKNLILCQFWANVIYFIEYILLNAVGASLMNFSSVIRSFIYYKYFKKNEQAPKYIMYVFIFIVLLIGIITFDNAYSIIPIFITTSYIYSTWQTNLKLTKITYIFCAFLWIIFNYQIGAYVTIVGNIFEILFGFYSLKKVK